MEALERRVVIDSLTSEKYLRVASISVAFYDYVLTLPAEWRFYRSQSSIFHISLACTLFILIRYISIMAIVISNYGFFSTTYTLQTCQQYYLVAPAFKAMQTMISQAILGVRAFNIARRDRRIGIVLLLLYLLSVSAEWFSDMFHRTLWAVQIFVNHSCTSGDAGKVLSTWFYYLAVLVYDIVIVTISTMHLLRYNPLSSRVEQLIRVLIYDGIGYLIVLSAANVLNLILYHTTNIDTQVLGYALTWIMSQRILINIRGMLEPHVQHLENVIVARPTLTATKKVMSGLRSQFESKSHSKGSNGSKNPVDTELRAKSPRNSNDMELGIRVRVERSVMVDYTEESEQSSSWVK
ncbi:uncharacterized protein F5891DRAFT_992949 [Suillus fuscotomentosus]|uniref:DUF6533 domain-containing protein n=1 Tax=Suillus fuscotomentosus TaxID=1912939 RepID=A0AAD4ELK0_9AGAM|nr:uncharacterized protein F5891DRAFT_992949 [Suillus fuscotomentosus]KAG1908425.1 hypothetical protein F5891DRAFT_992949 [Suillus fuscotomentosus]